MVKYDIQMFDWVKVIDVAPDGYLRDVLKTGIPSDTALQVIEIYHHERWSWRYVVAETEYPFENYEVSGDDIYEVNHPPEVFYEQRNPYVEED